MDWEERRDDLRSKYQALRSDLKHLPESLYDYQVNMAVGLPLIW